MPHPSIEIDIYNHILEAGKRKLPKTNVMIGRASRILRSLHSAVDTVRYNGLQDHEFSVSLDFYRLTCESLTALFPTTQ